jgi:hypothetical protein
MVGDSQIGKTSLMDIINPHKKLVKSTERIIQQLQHGGYEIVNGIVTRRRRREEKAEERRTRQRLDIDYNLDLLHPREEDENDLPPRQRQRLDNRLVNVPYRIYFIMRTADREIPRSKNGFLRNVRVQKVEQALEDEANDFIEQQAYETIILHIGHQVVEIPEAQVPLMEQRMFGTVIKYHHLAVEANSTENNDCVYQFLLNHYSKYIKNISRTRLA